MNKKIIAYLLVLTLFFTGCSSVPSETTASETSGDVTTVGDLFTTPTQTTVPATTSDNEVPIPTASHTEKSILDGSANFLNRWQTHIYTGGETSVPYQIYLEGEDVERDGVGVLLLLDGLPQPYRTDHDGTYRYMHTFHPKSGVETLEQLYFIPVTGQQGDSLELQACPVLFPNTDMIGAVAVSYVGGLNGCTRYDRMLLKYEQTPPETEPLPVKERVLSWSNDTREITHSDYPRGTDQDFWKDHVRKKLWVNDLTYAGGRNDHTADTPVNLHLEAFGAGGVECTLVLYVDHEPVSVAHENTMHFEIVNGKVNLIDGSLDLSDFDGETLMYALYAVRNAGELGVDSGMDAFYRLNEGYYYFFVDYPRPSK